MRIQLARTGSRTVFDWLNHHHDDGKYITSAGGTKSFEAALYLAEHLYGAAVVRRLAKGLVIDWDLSTVRHLVVE